jgi:hypothetical protein
MSQAIETAVEKYRSFLEAVETRIEANIANGKNTPATTLAKDLGKEFNWDWQVAYRLVHTYLQVRPELKVFGGIGGGVGLKDKVVESK